MNVENNGPGTPIYRLSKFFEELDKRFPGVVNPILSDPPEPKYLAAIDRVIQIAKFGEPQASQTLPLE